MKRQSVMEMSDNQLEIRDMVLEAKEKFEEAMELMAEYVRATGDRNTDAYLVDQMRTHLEEGGMMSGNLTFEKVIEKIETGKVEVR